MITVGTTPSYVTVVSCADNGNGTQTLVLDAPVAGTIVSIQFLETVRLEQEDVPIVFEGPAFSTTLIVRVVQQ